jgi:putative transposase
MARSPRYFIEDQPHHVIQRGNNRSPLFVSEADYLFYLLCLAEIFPTHGVAIHAHVLMTNHVHLLVTPAEPQSVPKAMKALGCRYVRHFNHVHQRTGTLLEGRYRSTLVDTVRYFLTCMRYIESNAVRAGMVTRPEEYRWSSYRANALGSDSRPALAPHQVYLELGPTRLARESAYRQLFRNPLPPQDIEVIRRSTNRGWMVDDGESEEAGAGPGSDPDASVS